MSKINDYFIDHSLSSRYITGPMANTKSAIKRIRRISRQTTINKSRKSRFKSAIKKINLLLDSKKKKRSISLFAEIKFWINEDCKNWNYKKRKCVKKYFKNYKKNQFNLKF